MKVRKYLIGLIAGGRWGDELVELDPDCVDSWSCELYDKWEVWATCLSEAKAKVIGLIYKGYQEGKKS